MLVNVRTIINPLTTRSCPLMIYYMKSSTWDPNWNKFKKLQNVAINMIYVFIYVYLIYALIFLIYSILKYLME